MTHTNGNLATPEDDDDGVTYRLTEAGLAAAREYGKTPEGQALHEWLEMADPKPGVADFMRERGFHEFADGFELENPPDP